MSAGKIVNDIASDALATVRRMGEDARHLRELGARTSIAARAAGRHAKAQIERGVERIADGIVAFEAAARGIEIKRGRR